MSTTYALPACYPAADVYDAVPNVEADGITGKKDVRL